MLQSFETFENAKVRTEKNQERIKQGVKRKRNHVGKEGSYIWKSNECYEEVYIYITGSNTVLILVGTRAYLLVSV